MPDTSDAVIDPYCKRQPRRSQKLTMRWSQRVRTRSFGASGSAAFAAEQANAALAPPAMESATPPERSSKVIGSHEDTAGK